MGPDRAQLLSDKRLRTLATNDRVVDEGPETDRKRLWAIPAVVSSLKNRSQEDFSKFHAVARAGHNRAARKQNLATRGPGFEHPRRQK